MRSTIFTVLLTAVTGALAGTAEFPWKRDTCAAVQVPFHFNTTEIGYLPSCSLDVMNRGGPIDGSTPAERRGTRTLSHKKPYHGKPYPIPSASSSVVAVVPVPTSTATACIDGPVATYTVVAGDTLERIAALYNSGVCDIATANAIADPDFILVGQVLLVPTSVCVPDNNSCRTPAGTATCVPADAGIDEFYTIQAGDTFFALAARFGITLDALVAANPGVVATDLQIGQIINVPICDDESS